MLNHRHFRAKFAMRGSYGNCCTDRDPVQQSSSSSAYIMQWWSWTCHVAIKPCAARTSPGRHTILTGPSAEGRTDHPPDMKRNIASCAWVAMLQDTARGYLEASRAVSMTAAGNGMAAALVGPLRGREERAAEVEMCLWCDSSWHLWKPCR